jgi:hypothetical protein
MVSTEDDEPAEGKGAKIALRQLVKDTAEMGPNRRSLPQ